MYLKKYKIINQFSILSIKTEKYGPLTDLFTDVYDELPKHLKEQQKELFDHLAKYKEHYDLSKY